MNKLFLIALLYFISQFSISVQAASSDCPDTLNFQVRTLAGKHDVNLCERYLGKVIMIVNTASKCGFTPQYDGLEALYRKYKNQGFVVLGFPSNDFGRQEPGSEKEIQEFCRLTYGVEFPMFGKTRTAKDNADPLYRKLGHIAGEYPQWNFHKYILDRNGKLVASFNSRTEPMNREITRIVEKLL